MSPIARLAVLVAVLPPACRELPPPEPRGHFTFGVFGDGPYTGGELARFRRLLDDVNRAEISFLIHVGDLLWYACSDEALLERREALRTVECARRVHAGRQRVDGLPRAPRGRLRAARPSERRSPPLLRRHDVERREPAGADVAVARRRVGLLRGERALVGARAALAWMRQTFAIATEQDARAVVLAMHADPDFERAGERAGAYAPLLSALETEAARFGKPVLLVHGDSHEQRADRPLRGRDTGDTVRNLVRLETYGSPEIGWVLVAVDTLGPELFSFEPRLLPRQLWLW